MKLFPLPNNPGTGVGGLTNNYQRQEDRTFDRDNYDNKVELEPDLGASDLGQVQLHERRGR